MEKEYTIPQRLTNLFFKLKGWDFKDKKYRPIYARFISVVTKKLLPMAENDADMVAQKILDVKEWAESNDLEWNLETVCKRWLEKNEVKLLPYDKNGNHLFEEFGTWKVKYPDGRVFCYPDSEKDIIWK